jgi:hypothetical protein
MVLHISDVKEKEIDFLLAEEFASSESFTKWFLGKTEEYYGSNFEVKKVARSHTDSYGESDLEVFLENTEGYILILLIENKISANFQDNQLLRYQRRGETYLNQNKCDDYKVILIAPNDYGVTGDNQDIDLFIPYEELSQYFSKMEALNKRYIFKSYILEKAIEKATLGYQPIEDKQATRFWKNYWEFVNQIAPTLNMPKPGNKPSGSSFINFYPNDLADGLSLKNKATFGVVDLQISNLAKNIGGFRADFRKQFDIDLELAKAGKSVSIRKSVPKLDLQKPTSEQKSDIKVAIDEAHSLYLWYRENKQTIHKLINKWL